MDAAVYARISLDRDERSESPERQVALCRRLCEERGWRVGKEFIDRDVSAYTSKRRRPGLDGMFEAVEAGRVEAVVVWKLDRLTRNYLAGGKILARLQEAGVQLVSVTEQLDTSTPMGQAIVGFQVAQAETESRNTSLRVATAWAAKAARGEPHVGGRRCFGYTAQCELVPAEAAAARDAIDRVLAGESLRSVARHLNEAGHLTTAGRPWSRITLKQWLRAPTIAGVRSHRAGGAKIATETPGSWEPILRPGEREALLVRLSSVPRGRPSMTAPRLLSGLVACGMCHSAMYAKRGARAGELAYVCSKCGRISIQLDGTDAEVTDRVLTFLSNTELRPIGEQDPASLRAALAEDEAELVALTRARYVERRLTDDQFRSAHDDLTARVEAVRSTLAAWERSAAGSGALKPGDRADLDKWWAAATIPERREALHRVVKGVIVLPALHGRNRFDPRRIGVRFQFEAFALSSVEGLTMDEFGNLYEVEFV